jgi:hypothetical protein
MQSRLEKVDKFECSNKILFECETKHNAKIKKKQAQCKVDWKKWKNLDVPIKSCYIDDLRYYLYYNII